MDEQRFRPGQLDLDRAAGEVGHERGVVLHAHILLAAEAAADKLVLHADLVGAEQELTLVQRGMGRLVGGQDHDIAVLVHIRDRALRLEERMLGPRGLKVLGDDVFGVLDRRLGVAAGDVLVGLHVGFFLVEDARGVLGPGLGGIMDGGQRLVGHFDELFRLFEDLGRFCDHERDRVAEVMRQPADGDERILVVLEMTDLVFPGNIRRRDDADDAGQRRGLRRVDGEDARARILAAHGGAVAHVGDVPVVGIFARAEDLFLDIDAVDARAELPVILRRRGDDALAPAFGGQTHGGEDLYIARAAAVVVAQGIADLIVGRIGVFIEQRLGAKHHARDAEAALHCPGLAVGVGIELLFFLRQTLDGDDVAACERIGKRGAGADGLAVDEHGAGAAGALGTAVLDGGQVQRIAQVAQQPLVLLHRHFRSVDKKYSHGKNSF